MEAVISQERTANYFRHACKRALQENSKGRVETCNAGRAGTHLPSEAAAPDSTIDRADADRSGARPYHATRAVSEACDADSAIAGYRSGAEKESLKLRWDWPRLRLNGLAECLTQYWLNLSNGFLILFY